MVFTTMSGHSDYPTTAPAIDSTVANDERFVTDAVGSALPSINRAELWVDLIRNIRAAANVAGVNLTALTRGDSTAFTKIIQGLSSDGITQTLATAANYTYSSARGFRPLLRVQVNNQFLWSPSFNAEELINGDIALDIGAVNRTLGTNVRGDYVGSFNTGVYNVNSGGVSTTHTLQSSDIGKAVYLVTSTVTSDGIRYSYALWESIAFEKQFEARYVGRVTAVNSNAHTATIAFNLLSDSEKRVRRKLIYNGPNSGIISGNAGLVTGVKFSDFSTIEFVISDQGVPREYSVVPVPYDFWSSSAGIGGVTTTVNLAFLAVKPQPGSEDTRFQITLNRYSDASVSGDSNLRQTAGATLLRIYGVL